METNCKVVRTQLIRALTGGEVPFFHGRNPIALEAFTTGAAAAAPAAPDTSWAGAHPWRPFDRDRDLAIGARLHQRP